MWLSLHDIHALCVSSRRLSVPGEVFFHAFHDIPAREQYPPTAALAFQSNICPQTHDIPIRTPTGMRLSHSDNIFHL